MKPPYDKFEIERRPEPNFEMNATAWLLNNIWLMAVPPILLILACVFKNELDEFFGTLVGHAFLSLFLGFSTVVIVYWSFKRICNKFINK